MKGPIEFTIITDLGTIIRNRIEKIIVWWVAFTFKKLFTYNKIYSSV